MISNEALEHWASFYVANNIQAKGLSFELFITDPDAYCEALVFGCAMPLNEDFYPLLSEQQAVADKLVQQEAFEDLSDDMTNRFERKHIVLHRGDRNIERMDNPKSKVVKRWKACSRPLRKAS